MSYNILVVDDSAITRSIVKRALSLCGLPLGAVYEAANGAEALAKLSEEWIDIVFTDINMPEMNGVEMVNKMAEDNLLVTVPVVIISTERNQEQIEALKKTGIRAYLKKPFKPENIRDVVQDILSAKGGVNGS
jgi:two-component system chemotaxis response regulator CheY